MQNGLNKTDLSAEVKLATRIVVSLLYFIFERVGSLRGAMAVREVIYSPLAELERKWGLEKR